MRDTPLWRRYLRLRGPDPDADARDELEFHLASRVDDLRMRGRTEQQARDEAAREFGDVDRVRSELRALGRRQSTRAERARRFEAWWQDVRFGTRTLRKSPGFALVAVLTLAVGIGGTTAVFSVVQAVLLAPLPYAEPGRLVRLYQHNEGEVDESREYLTGPHFLEVRDRASSFEDVAALFTYRETGLDLSEGGRPVRLRVLEVSAPYFAVLGARPARGTGFTAQSERGEVRTVILSDELWRTHFGSANVLGSTIQLSGVGYEVVGIAPPGFEDPVVGTVDAWLPMDLAGGSMESEHNHHLTTIARLRPGVTIERAREELGALSRALAERWPDVAEDSLIVLPLKEDLVGASAGTLRLLLLAVAMVLLVACVNVANLFLVRATGRAREFAVRSALGSGSGRIARQLLIESLLLAIAGGALGVLLAVFAVDALVALARESIPRIGSVGFDVEVLGFALLVTLLTGVGFGMAPALRFARTAPGSVLRSDSRAGTGSRRMASVRTGLAVAQMALALTLLAGAGVLMMSFVRIQQVELGFRTENALTFELALPAARYNAAQRAMFFEQLSDRLATLPGVIAAGGTSRLPATGAYHSWGTQILTGPLAGSDRSQQKSEQRIVSGEYFAAQGIRLLAGRTFDARDEANAPPRAIVSESFAREAFPGLGLNDALGNRIVSLGPEREIVGVVADVAIGAHGEMVPTVYRPHTQFAANRNWALTQVVAASTPPERLLPLVRAAVAELDPELIVHRPLVMSDVVGRGIARERFALVLMAAFAAIALLLAALGLYGVLAYSVRQRSREIGIRVALGATTANVRRLVLGHAARVALLGVMLGAVGSVMLGRWLSSLVFQTSPFDPRIMGASALALSAVAILAGWLPARRATRIDPQMAIREE